jgi:hypothetical protein
LDWLATQPLPALTGALTLYYQPRNLGILPLYVVLLSVMAVALPLLRRPTLALTVSFGVYAVALLGDINLPAAPSERWLFNPFAWQLLFFIGAVTGGRLAGRSTPDFPYSKAGFWACSLVLVVTAVTRILLSGPAEIFLRPYAFHHVIEVVTPYMPGPGDKTWLHPVRLITILALAYVARFVTDGATWLHGPLAAPFVLLGQHGLAVFCVTVPGALLMTAAIEQRGDALAQITVNMLAFAALLAVAISAAWFRTSAKTLGRPRRTALDASDSRPLPPSPQA